MAPAITVPRLLDRVGLRLGDIDLIEIHEAFAAQVLANAAAWEQGWKGPATGPGELGSGQRQWKLDRHRASLVRNRRTDSHHPGLRDGASERAVWTHQHVCGRGHGRGISAHAGVMRRNGGSVPYRRTHGNIGHMRTQAGLIGFQNLGPNHPALTLGDIGLRTGMEPIR